MRLTGRLLSALMIGAVLMSAATAPAARAAAVFTPATTFALPSGTDPDGIAFDPAGSLVAVADYDTSSVSLFSVSPGGALGELVASFPAGSGPVALSFSPSGGLLAIADLSTSQVTVLSVSSTGTLTEAPGSPVQLSGGPYDVAFSPNGGLLATADSGADVVQDFAVAANGALTSAGAQATPAGSDPASLAFSPAGDHLIAGDHGTDALSVFSVSPAGALATVGSPVAVAGPPNTVSFSPAGLLAVSDSSANALSLFSIGSTGALTAVPGSPFPAGAGSYPTAAAFSPNGALLAAADLGYGTIAVSAVSAGGALTPVAGSPLGSGSGVSSVAFGRDGGLLGSVVGGLDEVQVFSVAAPVASIASPAPGGVYRVGQHVPTAYACADASGAPGIAACADSDGGSAGAGHLDTSAPGTATYTVTATSLDGQTAGTSITYTVEPATVSTPVPTRISVPPSAGRHIHATILLSWTWSGPQTRLRRLRISGVPRDARITLRCRGRGCPRAVRAMTLRTAAALRRALVGSRYRAGDRLWITIVAPGRIAERAEVVFRDAALPRTTLL